MSDRVENRLQAPLEMEWSSQAETFVQLSTAISQLQVVRHAFTHDFALGSLNRNEHTLETKVARDLSVLVTRESEAFDNESTAVAVIARKFNKNGVKHASVSRNGQIAFRTIDIAVGEGMIDPEYFITSTSPQEMLDNFTPTASSSPEEMRKVSILARQARVAFHYAEKHLLSGQAFIDLF